MILSWTRRLLASVERPRDEIDTLQNVFGDMAERISDQMQGLRQVDRLRRELITNVSHDLRTPLAALQGYLETLQLKGDLNKRSQNLLRRRWTPQRAFRAPYF